jgi:hypothetical protein
MSLVEVVIATAVLMVGLAGVSIALLTGLHLAETGRSSMLGSQVLQSEMETLRLLNWVEISALPAQAPVPISQDYANISRNFSSSRTVRTVNDALKEVTVQIDWECRSGHRHTRAYRTYFAKEGLNDYYYRSF